MKEEAMAMKRASGTMAAGIAALACAAGLLVAAANAPPDPLLTRDSALATQDADLQVFQTL
jgi:hypothetical protein